MSSDLNIPPSFEKEIEFSTLFALEQADGILEVIKEMLSTEEFPLQIEVLYRLFLLSFLTHTAQYEGIFTENTRHQKMIDSYWEKLIWAIDSECNLAEPFHKIFCDIDNRLNNLEVLLMISIYGQDDAYNAFVGFCKNHDYAFLLSNFDLTYKKKAMGVNFMMHTFAYQNLGMSFHRQDLTEKAIALQKEAKRILDALESTINGMTE